MVRPFDRELPVTLVQPFAEVVQAAQRWIDKRPALARLVRVEQPVEVGRDFISRSYLLYYTSTDAYVDWEDPPQPPKELALMRNAFRKAAGKSADPKDVIVEAVLARSLLEARLIVMTDYFFDQATRHSEMSDELLHVHPSGLVHDKTRLGRPVAQER
jgi:hypothetical protein